MVGANGFPPEQRSSPQTPAILGALGGVQGCLMAVSMVKKGLPVFSGQDTVPDRPHNEE